MNEENVTDRVVELDLERMRMIVVAGFALCLLGPLFVFLKFYPNFFVDQPQAFVVGFYSGMFFLWIVSIFYNRIWGGFCE